jgi:hypothetical protein
MDDLKSSNVQTQSIALIYIKEMVLSSNKITNSEIIYTLIDFYEEIQNDQFLKYNFFIKSRIITDLISFICRNEIDVESISNFSNLLKQILYHEDEEMLMNFTSIMFRISNQNSQFLIENDLTWRLKDFLLYRHNRLQFNAIQTIKSILRGGSSQIDHILSLGIVEIFNTLLFNSEKDIWMETVESISCILEFGNDKQIQYLLDHSVISTLLKVFKKNEIEFQVQISNLFAIATSNPSKFLMKTLLSFGILKIFKDCLNSKLSLISLEIIENILNFDTTSDQIFSLELEDEDGIPRIMDLTAHEDEEINSIAKRIMINYFTQKSKLDYPDQILYKKLIETLGGIEEICGLKINKNYEKSQILVKFRNMEECGYLNYENHRTECQHFIDFLQQNASEFSEEPLIPILKVIQNDLQEFEVYSNSNQVFNLNEISKLSLDQFLNYFK